MHYIDRFIIEKAKIATVEHNNNNRYKEAALEIGPEDAELLKALEQLHMKAAEGPQA